MYLRLRNDGKDLALLLDLFLERVEVCIRKGANVKFPKVVVHSIENWEAEVANTS
jgi:hypothetical protein